MASYGGSVKLEGESAYRNAIKNITKDLQGMSSALKTQTADFNSNDKSIKNNAQAQKQLNETIKTQQNELAKAKSQYAQLQVAVQNQTIKHNLLNKEYKNAVTELERIRATSGETSTEFKKQAEVVDRLGQELADSSEAMNENKEAMANLKSEISNSQRVINGAEQSLNGLGNETADSGDKAKKGAEGYTIFKNILANLGTQVINAAINGIKKLGSSMVNLGKQALDNYANYEQLIGGVETLFGKSASVVEQYANEAYKTAGISANQYMETVTSFSASLLQSLGGDTQKAAEYSNRALIDMSDNANKMGTDMSMIQNAYQGFAKQNYTMLDNLKLGYGGTKTEMQRLIKDASQLTDVQKELGITVDANDMSFGNIVNAISVVQKEMGIMGTTSKEASETIQGSVSSMKSAWQNLLTGIADDNAEFDTLINNFIESLETALKNLLPRIKVIIQGIGMLLASLLQYIANSVLPELPAMIRDLLPVLIDAVRVVIEGIGNVLPELATIIGEIIPQIVQMLFDLAPLLLQSGIDIILNLIDGISAALPQLIAMLPTLIQSIINVITKNLPLIIKTGVNLLMALIEGIVNAIPDLIDMLPTIIATIIETIVENFPLIISTGIDLLVALINGILDAIPKLIEMIPTIIRTIVDTLKNNLPKIVESGKEILKSLVSGIGSMISNVGSKMGEVGSAILNKIKEVPGKMLEVGKNLVQGLWNGISNAKDWVLNKIKGFGQSILNGIKSFFGIASPSKLFRDEIGENLALGIGEGFSDEMRAVTKDMENAVPTSFDINSSSNSSGLLANSSYYTIVEAFKEALGQMTIELDDENMGKFIDKTVANAIYS